MELNLPDGMIEKVQTLAAQLGIEPEALITMAIERMTEMDSEGLLAMISGDHSDDVAKASALLTAAKSMFDR